MGGKSWYEVYRRPTRPRKDHPEDDKWVYFKDMSAYSKYQAGFLAKKWYGDSFQYEVKLKKFKATEEKGKDMTTEEKIELGKGIVNYIRQNSKTQLWFANQMETMKRYQTKDSRSAMMSQLLTGRVAQSPLYNEMYEEAKELLKKLESEKKAEQITVDSESEKVGMYTNDEKAKILKRAADFLNEADQDERSLFATKFCLEMGWPADKLGKVYNEMHEIVRGETWKGTANCDTFLSKLNDVVERMLKRREMEVENGWRVSVKTEECVQPLPKIIKVTMTMEQFKDIEILADALGYTPDLFISKLAEKAAEKGKNVIETIKALREEYL